MTTLIDMIAIFIGNIRYRFRQWREYQPDLMVDLNKLNRDNIMDKED